MLYICNKVFKNSTFTTVDPLTTLVVRKNILQHFSLNDCRCKEHHFITFRQRTVRIVK